MNYLKKIMSSNSILDRKIYGFVYKKKEDKRFEVIFNEREYKINPEKQYHNFFKYDPIPETSLVLVEHSEPLHESCRIYPVIFVKLEKHKVPIKASHLSKEDLIKLAYSGAQQYIDLKKSIIDETNHEKELKV